MPGLFDGAFDPSQYGLLASLLGGAKGSIFGQLNPAVVGQDLAGMAGHMATLPQRAMQSADMFQRTGEYDPAPILETAGMMVGFPGTPRGALGSGARLPQARGAPSAAIEGEILPPSTALAAQPKGFDWSKPLLDTGFHPAQLQSMTAQEIERAGAKVVETRLGPMLPALRELGYSPQELINMNPAEAYRAIKGKIVTSQPEDGSAAAIAATDAIMRKLGL